MANDMDIRGIDILPHREPFLYLDWLISYSKDGSVGRVTFGAERDFFRGHFPDYPIVPGVILLEAMCQSAWMRSGSGIRSLRRMLGIRVRTLCGQVPIPLESLDLLIPHQANSRILEAVARRMSFPLEKFYINLRHIGNTSSVSIPLCFFLIAGSYTPFCLVSLRPEHPALAWSIFGIEWGLTLVGVVFKALTTGRYRFLSTLSYIIMGWVAILAIIPLARALQDLGTMWLVLGGGLYTLGCVFYLWRYIT